MVAIRMYLGQLRTGRACSRNVVVVTADIAAAEIVDAGFGAECSAGPSKRTPMRPVHAAVAATVTRADLDCRSCRR